MNIRFFTRKDFGGWRKYTWLPVTLLQGKYVHCELEVDGIVFNADNKRGIVRSAPGPSMPSAIIEVPHDVAKYEKELAQLIGQPYSWSAFFRLLIPKWGSDPKGMICSELVAHMLAKCAVLTEFRVPFIAVPPYRWTPDALQQALSRLSSGSDA